MQVIEYEDKYLEDVKDLLVELEEYIVSIDKDHLDQVHPEYREKMAIIDLEEVNKNNGKCYLATENNKAIGLIMGCIFPYDEHDYLDYKCPKRGEITELIVKHPVRLHPGKDPLFGCVPPPRACHGCPRAEKWA